MFLLIASFWVYLFHFPGWLPGDAIWDTGISVSGCIGRTIKIHSSCYCYSPVSFGSEMDPNPKPLNLRVAQGPCKHLGSFWGGHPYALRFT